MNTSYESGSAGPLRIGDAERWAAAAALGDHFAAGRLDQGEFDERTAAVYAARTYADLEPPFADLPEPWPTRPTRAAPAPAESRPAWPNPDWPSGWPPPGQGLPPGRRGPRRRGPASRVAWMLPALPFPVLLLGTLVLLSLISMVMFLGPFLLIPVFWVFCARGGVWRRRHHHWG